MHNINIMVALVMAICSLVIGLLAWLIKYRKKATLISGYNPEQYHDPDGLCNWVGGTLLKIALAVLVCAVLMLVYPSWLPALTAIFAGSIVVGGLTAAIGAGKFRLKG